MKITLVRSMARSAVFELVNSGCYRAPAPYTVSLDGATVCERDTNVFSLYSLEPGRSYTLAVTLDGVTDTLDFTTAEESFFVDASRYGLVADGVTDNTAKLQAALSWTIHPTYSENVDILNIRIRNSSTSPNTDGIDPESCKNVNIIGNHVHVGDDCIALKSGKLFLGMKLHVPCENVIIRNCCLSRGHGGLVIGSEMSGGVKNVTVTQCLMDHTDRGLRVKTRRGRGKYAIIDGLVFRDVVMDGVLAPFVINMFYFCDPDGRSDYVQTHEALPVDEMTPTLGTLEMENITATDAQYAGCWFSGLPEHPIEGVKMHNVKISFAPDAKAGQAAMMCGADASCKVGVHAENVQRIELHNVAITGYEGERLQLTNVDSFEED